MKAVLVLAVVVVGLVATLFSSYAGLLLYSWFAFFRPQEWAWGALTSLRLSMVIGATFLASALGRGQLPSLRHPLAIGMVLFLASALVSQVGAVQPSAGWDGLDMTARMIVVSLLAITIVNTPKRLAVLVAVVAGSVAFHGSKFGVGYLIRGGAHFDAGMGGLFSDNNDFALAIARSIFLLVPVAQNGRARWLKGGVVVALPLCAIAIVSTFSRGGMLAVAAAAVTFVALQRRKVLALVALTVLLAAGAALVPVSEQYTSRGLPRSTRPRTRGTTRFSVAYTSGAWPCPWCGTGPWGWGYGGIRMPTTGTTRVAGSLERSERSTAATSRCWRSFGYRARACGCICTCARYGSCGGFVAERESQDVTRLRRVSTPLLRTA